MIPIHRSDENPILAPSNIHSWEAAAVFNGCPAKRDDKFFLIYRALSLPHYHASADTKMEVSSVGIVESDDGINFRNRRRFIIPEYDWERFGCEDPRVTQLNGKYYIFYTALSKFPFEASGIKVGVALSDDLESIQEKHPVTPFNAKGMALFPEKIDDKMWSILTVNTDSPPSCIALAPFEEEGDMWSEEYWNSWYENLEQFSLNLKRHPNDHVEAGAPPVKTEHGWLLFYSHIKNYFSGDKLFSIEAVLLDPQNPLKIIGRTNAPILFPEQYYERIGITPDVVFPSGAMLEDGWVYLYYGAADTTCALAFFKLSDLMDQILERRGEQVQLKRGDANPIITPNSKNSWESKATFNPAAIRLEDKTHILYRAMSKDNTSVLGYAASEDGLRIDERLDEPVYTPREDFEKKKNEGGNSGCEDPRLSHIDGRIYLTYTAYDGVNPPRVALSSIGVEDFIAKKWNWSRPKVISPADFDDKDAFIFPEKVRGKYMVVHRVGEDIDYSLVSSLEFKEGPWLEEVRWIGPRRGWWDSKKVGAAAPPLKTDKGWIMLYHGVSHDNVYRVGAVLLSLEDPSTIIARTQNPIFEPEVAYEKVGEVNNVVFPCGNVLINDKLFMYYGGADKVSGVATIDINELFKDLVDSKVK